MLPIGKPLAYEFKLRVTIAASGQGRFAEEQQFAEDCANSGATPVLIVLDPTPNPRLRDLEASFRHFGGNAFIGAAAWTHLEAEAGSVMAKFIENYVRVPVTAISAFEVASTTDGRHPSFRLLDLAAKVVGNELSIKLGAHERTIRRREDQSLADDSEDDGQAE